MRKIAALILLFSFYFSDAQNCDSTQYFATHYYSLQNGLNAQNFFDKNRYLISNKCFNEILDSINHKNAQQNLTFISNYFYFTEQNPFIKDNIDSTVTARISYHIADTDEYMASTYRSYYTGISKQYVWILQRNEKSRATLQQYILSQQDKIDLNWVKFACLMKDSVAFWHAYSVIIKNKRYLDKSKNSYQDKYALIGIINYGMEYFKYYYLFEKNLNELIDSDEFGGNVSSTIIDELPIKVNKEYARKLYDSTVLNVNFMKRNSVAGQLAPRTAPSGYNVSIFNYSFIRGIQIFYPELMQTKEYQHYNDEPIFSKDLYNLLVKTIKAKN